MKVEYSSNNSGGSWWLQDKHWRALERAGWKVFWVKDSAEHKKHVYLSAREKKDGRWMGALAVYAEYPTSSLKEAIESWEAATGKDATALGCSCCGTPHNFTLQNDEGEYVDSWSPEYPSHGERNY